MVENANQQQASPQRKGDRWFVATVAILWALAVLHFALQFSYTWPHGGQPYLVGLDQNGYFAYAHSLLFDQDLNFANQYRFLATTQPEGTAEVFRGYLDDNASQPTNQFNIGTGIAALPALVLARGVFWLLALMGAAPGVSAYSSVYPFVFGAMNITFAAGALVCCYYFLRRWFSSGVSAAGTYAVLLCGPMLYYVWAEPGMSHLTGAFFTSAALLLWSRWEASTYLPRKCLFAALAGFCAAFAGVVRPYDIPVAVVLAQPLLCAVANRRMVRAALIPTLIAAVGGALAALPQLVAWKIQFGDWIVNTTKHPLVSYSPYALHVLFSRRHGLFFWSPALLLAIIALILAIRHNRFPAAWLLLVFLGVTYLAGTWWYYWVGVSFGMRSYVDHPVPFAFGFAVIADWLVKRYGRSGLNYAWELILLFVIVNMHLIICFRGGATYVDGPLYWTDTISHGKVYKAQVLREISICADFTKGRRANLLNAPPGWSSR